MSRCFRSVVEQWGPFSDTWIAPDSLAELLEEIAGQVGCASERHEYGDMLTVWIEDGNSFLDLVEAGGFAVPDELRSEAGLDDLLQAMKSCASDWRKCLDEGALRFYIDLY